VRFYIFPQARVDIGYHRVLNLGNASDNNGFVIQLGDQ
jgi:hypothetical protein